MNITRLLEDYKRDHPDVRVTNVSQIFRSAEVYASRLQEDFKGFGKHAGFKNSIYEKYVLFPAGITSHWTQGSELVMMNAKPFPTPDGMVRYVVITDGNRYGATSMPEGRVQEMLGQLGIAEPGPLPMPPASPVPARAEDDYRESLVDKWHKLFAGCAQVLGMSHTKGWILEWAACSAIAIAILLGWFWFWRRSRR